MENQKVKIPNRSKMLTEVVKTMPKVMKASKKISTVALLVVVAVWCAGRAMENLHGNPVYDSTSTFWLGMVVSILFILWMAGLVFQSFESLKILSTRKANAFVWGAFFAIVTAILLSIEGFQISVAGLMAAFTGSVESSQNAAFLLLKYHPANPMLAVNLGAQAATGSGWDIASLTPYVWHWNVLFYLYIWSVALGILLLTRANLKFMKTLHLTLATAGLTALIIFKSKSLITVDYRVMFQAALLLLILLQALMIYASLRRSAAEEFDASKEGKPQPFGEPKEPKEPEYNHHGLPPSAIAITLSLFFVLPILADLEQQAILASHTRQFIKNAERTIQDKGNVLVAVAPLTIRSGPSMGDDVLGVLPKGARIRFQEVQFGWVNMGENHWVPEKFLRPLAKDKRVSQIGSANKQS